MKLRAYILPLFFALLTPQQRELNVKSFEQVWATIRDRHWDPKLGGVDWQAVHDELRPKVEQADNMEKAREVFRDMIGRLNQTHFGIVPAEVYKDIDQPGRDASDGWTGIDPRVIDGKALVAEVEPGSPAARAGVRRGWQIVKVNGNELAPAIEKIGETYKTSTLREILLMRMVQGRLNGKVDEKARVAFVDAEDKAVEVEIGRVAPKGTPVKFGYLPPMFVWVESHRLDGNIGYVRFNAFLDPAHLMKSFEDAVVSCKDCAGFIIDVRGNPGGIGAMAMGMAGWFVEKQDQQLGTMYMRQTPLKFVINPRIETFKGPVAILVDGGSGSTSEVFAGGMKDLGRARIFGTRTAGAALPSVFERLPNGDGFQYAIANYISEGGKPLEGIGVIPDVETPLTRAVLLEGRDPAVEAAERWIGAQRGMPRSRGGRASEAGR